MENPRNIGLPFFAYGLFRPRQLAYFQIHEFVELVNEPVEVEGSLRLRDGLPILDVEGGGLVKGALLTFSPERAKDAYRRISDMEPDEHYRWDEYDLDGTPINVLCGRSPKKGSVPLEEDEWDGWDDPLFSAALEVVEETLNSQEFDWDLKPMFRLQMAYLLLWSSIERYVSLRYHFGNRVTEKVAQLAREPAFAESLKQHVKRDRAVHRADRPRDKAVLDPQSPEHSLKYYYQVRSNITHRGKGVPNDYELLKNSLTELLAIFRDVFAAAKKDARNLASQSVGDDRPFLF